MARSVTVNLGGKPMTLKASFETGAEISARVEDLMFIQREAAIAGVLLERGIPYQPKWQFSLGAVVDILGIAMRHNGKEVTREEVGALCFEAGFDKAQGYATEFLQLHFAEPEVKPDIDDAVKDKEPGK